MMNVAFRENGYKIFGIYDFDGDMCGCGNVHCKAIGKHPRTRAWQNTPFWDDEQFENLVKIGSFSSGFGILCEKLIVIDVDVRNGGGVSYVKLCEAIPEIVGAGLIVNTGSGDGSQHLFFKNGGGKKLKSKLDEYRGIDFKSSGYVIGCGSSHNSGNKYEVAVGCVEDIDEAPQALLDLLERNPVALGDYTGSPDGCEDNEIESMLSVLDPDCEYEKWLQIGMAIHSATDGAGLELWVRWSKTAKLEHKRQDSEEYKWGGFAKASGNITVATLIHYAEERGWVRSVEFSTDKFADVHTEFDAIEKFNVDDVDLKNPPGFVGEVTRWINSQCNYKRENLAVAAAFTAVSNAGGMRLFDAEMNMYANLYSVCVAGSSSGKNNILKAIKKLAVSAGISPAMCGGIKSEQEIYRNLLRNQAVFYTVDEIGEILGKIVKAKAKGGAAYLDAVVAVLLTAYSSAGDSLLITGDLKNEIQSDIKKELKAHQKTLDKHEAKNAERTQERIEYLEKQLETTDTGIDDPFVSIFGLTTPNSFDELMDYEMSSNGFIARTLVFREQDNNPKFNNVEPADRIVPPKIQAELLKMYSGGYFSYDDFRIERKGGSRCSIETTSEARALLNEIRDKYFWELAEEHDEKTGLASIPRRGAEMCEKISMILAFSTMKRTVEHVRYAFAISKVDIELKLQVAHSNDSKKASGLFARVLSILSKEKGMSIGVISNRCRKYERVDIEKALVMLEEKDRVKLVKETSATNKSTVRFYLC